jgi:MFS transporter, PPP family, 3-phenylpropionic acid transporter
MPANRTRALTSPEGRTAVFYLFVFGIPGVTGAYFGIWLFDKGLSAGEIGWINSIPILLTLFFSLHVGRLADRAKDWRNIIIAGAFLSGLLPIGMFFVNDFWGLLIVWTLALLPFGLVMPVIDAATMRMTRRNGTNFAFVRAFGTIGYLLALIGTAWAVQSFGGGMFLPFVLVITLARAALSLLLPHFRAPTTDTLQSARPTPPTLTAGRFVEWLKPWFIGPILAFALVQGLHFILSSFAGIVWRDNGIAEGWVGPLLALGAVAEVMVMLLFKRFASRISARYLILFAMLVSAFRWGAMTFNPPLLVLALLQLTHGITFGLSYLGLMNFIANWTSEDVAAEAQSFAQVVQLSIVVLILSGFGYVIDAFGIHAFAAGIVTSLIAAVLVIWSLRVLPTAENAT